MRLADEGIELQNNQSTLHGTTIVIKCPAGGAITIWWGDGSASAVVCDNVVNSYAHTYTATGTYTIRITGTTTLISDFRCYSQAWISGPISGILRGLGPASLTSATLSGTAISGDVTEFSRFTQLSSLNIASTSVTGNLASFASCPLTYLIANSTALTGDVSSLAGQSYGTLYLYAVPALAYTGPTALPPWNGGIWLFSSGLSSTEVDQFLIDLADGCATSGTRSLKLAGTNAARTAASNAAKAALLAAGWTVEVNE